MKRGHLIVTLIFLVFFISSCEITQFSPTLSSEEEPTGPQIFEISTTKSNQVIIADLTEGAYKIRNEDGLEVTFSKSKSGEINVAGVDERIDDFSLRYHDGYIIELVEEPLAKTEKSIRSPQKEILELEHSNVKSLLSEKEIKVKKEFKKAFNGIVVKDLTKEQIKDLERDPKVKKIWPNYRVYLNLLDSTGMINADDMWSEGYTGEGVTIAVIDTGIDYTHPDLGGCMGPDCKILGGYDFINDDPDPMDDHGHGTHCAGIAASTDGNQEGLIGVAPGAKLYAFKVLSESGSGSMDGVVEGIEAAMDPNNDDDFSDHVDVISMSLGANCGTYSEDCGPDDPTSQAIDAATEIGVASAISAGNNYEYFSIGSPGAARTAITVGASCKPEHEFGGCDDSYPIAAFSSKGPVLVTGSDAYPKPDIVAPGVSICASQWEDAWQDSECMDDEHTAISGTSMSAPHVAGALALLKQSHPDWAPYELKSALMLSSQELEFGEEVEIPGINPNIFFQGTGQIDVTGANDIELFIDKQYIGDWLDSEEYSTTSPVTVFNTGNNQLELDIEEGSTGELYTGAGFFGVVTSSTDHLSIPPGQNETFYVEMNVPEGEGGIFYGKLKLLNSNGKTHIIPYTYSKLIEVTISLGDAEQFGNPDTDFFLMDSETMRTISIFNPMPVQEVTTYLPPNGDYLAAAISLFDEPDFIIYETFHVGDTAITKELNISNNRLFTISGKSPEGNELYIGEYEKAIRFTGIFGHTYIDPFVGDHEIYLSNKPIDFPNEIDIVLSLKGIENE